MSYTAPVKDMLFNMQHLAHIENICAIVFGSNQEG